MIDKPKYKIGDVVVVITACIQGTNDEGKRRQVHVIGAGWINFYLDGEAECFDEPHIYTEGYRQFKVVNALQYRYHKSDEFDEWNYKLESFSDTDWISDNIDESDILHKL